jgi:hypothetical protein
MRSPCHPCALVRRPPRRFAALLLGFAVLACATGAPAPPKPGTGTAWGYLHLVPREGVTPVKPGASPYADRRMRDVEFVDYSKPGFAVVHLDRGPSPRGSAELVIRSTGVRTRLDPPQAAVGAGGVVVVRNEAGAAHVISAPALGVVRRIEAGEKLELALADAGEQALFLLDVPRAESTLFVSPGAFVVVSADGRYELSELPPGHYALHAWHPRFPPTRSELDLAAGGVVRLDLEMGVDQSDVSENAPADQP